MQVNVDRSECDIHRQRIDQDLNKAFELIKENSRYISAIDRETAEQGITLKHLSETLIKLDITLSKFIETFNQSDRAIAIQTAVNSNNISWNWKTILAAGGIISFLVAIVLTFIQNVIG